MQPAETVLLQDQRVVVTSTRLVADGATLDVRAIGAVRVGKPAANQGLVGCITGLLGIAMLFGIFTYVGADSGCMGQETVGNGKLIVGALVAVAVALLFWARRQVATTHVVFVTVGGTERGILSSTDLAWANRVAGAIQQAMLAPKV